jgi:hypothetical protein
MPLAAHAIPQGGSLVLRAVLGHPGDVRAALLSAEVAAPVATDDAALALGRAVADALRAQGADAYLAAAASP